VLGREPQRRPARGEDVHARRGGQQVADERGSRQELLEVVEDEQQPPLPELVDHAVGERQLTLVHVQRLGDRRHEQLGVRDRRKTHEQRPVPHLGLERVR
jgi:hypothetical protein